MCSGEDPHFDDVAQLNHLKLKKKMRKLDERSDKKKDEISRQTMKEKSCQVDVLLIITDL